LKVSHDLLTNEVAQHRRNEEILAKLHQTGVIDENGKPTGRKQQ